MALQTWTAALVIAWPCAARAAGRGIVDTSASPHVEVRSVDLDDVRWTRGFWADRFARCRETMIPSLRRVMQDPRNAANFRNFRIAAGLEEGSFSGTKWGDGDCYKWLEAAAAMYALTGDRRLDRAMDEEIAAIARAQAPDGYISTYIQLTGRKRWQDLHDHELYNMGHLMTAACIHHRATGKTNFLAIARKVGDCLYGVFRPRPGRLAHFGFNPSNIMGAVELYRTTRDPRYLELARIFVDMRGSAPGGSDQNQTRVPLRGETRAVGHAVTACYLYCGAADVYAETGDRSLLEALERIGRHVRGRQMYITGAVGPLHRGLSVRGDPVHEAFGRDFVLPNRTAYNETCANIAYAMWNLRMLAATGQARYGDAMERVLYNSMLSGVGLDGKSFFYTNVLRRCGDDVPLLDHDTRSRWTDTTPPAPRCFCCPPNVVRTIAELGGWAYGLSEDAVWIHLYGGSVLETEWPDGSPVKLAQETEYPWEGRVTIAVGAAREEPFAVMLRIPGWADGAAIRVNGEPFEAALEPGRYAAVRRRWKAGDRIEVDLPMRVRLMEAHPLLEEVRNEVAVMRGPIVYCLESPDLPEGIRVDRVALPAGAVLTPRFRRDLLGGVTVLEGKARVLGRGDGADRLYREALRGEGRSMDLMLIPYYAWANRGLSQMTVWLSVAW